MLYFLVVWSILLLSCLSIGVLLLNWFNGDCFERIGDRFVVAVWIGVVVLCLSCMAAALIVPLSPLVGGLIIIAWLIIASLSLPVRTELVNFRSCLSPGLAIGCLLLGLVVAALTTQQIVWFDTGLYHLPLIRWLSEFGIVPGIALIHSKLGFTSSWFAFSAPFVPEFLGNRVGAITNGFLFLLALLNLGIFIYQNSQKNRSLSDGFSIIFLGIVIISYLVTIVTKSPIILSFSHDVPVTFLIGITAWTILIITNNTSSVQNQFLISPYFIPLFLGIGTATIKLTGLPVALTGFLFYLFYSLRNQLKIQRFLFGILMSIMLFLPNALSAIITSGCPLYPSKIMCLNTPWLVTNAIIEREIKQIRGVKPSVASTRKINYIVYFLQKRYEWFKSSLELQLIVISILISIVLSIWLFLKFKNINKQSKVWLIFLGISGSIFMLINIPLWRMGIGYFIIIFCLVIGSYIHQLKLTIKFSKNLKLINLLLLALVVLMLIQKGAIERLLLPAKLPSVKLIKAKINDIEYTYPADWQVRCWRAELPCAAVPLPNKIKLREPNKGIKAGFMNRT